MKTMKRREFLKNSLGAAALAGAGLPALAAPQARPRGANDEIRHCICGVRSRGDQLGSQIKKIPGVRIVALCDPDEDILNKRVQEYSKAIGSPVKGYTDIRKVIEADDIDTITVATPNHWHALATIWACQAGKDVYVEKPVSWSLWEGEQMIKASRKYNRIVQAGTQNRTDDGFRAAMEWTKEGHLGKLLFAHGLWFNHRKPIGKVKGSGNPPKSLDYDVWCGPASAGPLKRENLHYDWHWTWEYGSGEMGNVGIHQIDDCRFAIGATGMPKRSLSVMGNRFLWDDDGETPNMHITFAEFEEAPVIVEIRDLPLRPGTDQRPHYRGVRAGNIIQYEGGYFAGGRGGGNIYDNDGKRMKKFPGDGGGANQPNFFECVRSRRREDQLAEIEQGVYSTALCHTANISHRIGRDVAPERIGSAAKDIHDELGSTFETMFKHLEDNKVDFNKWPTIAGPWLTIDKATQKFVGDHADLGNKYYTRDRYRSGYEIKV